MITKNKKSIQKLEGDVGNLKGQVSSIRELFANLRDEVSILENGFKFLAMNGNYQIYRVDKYANSSIWYLISPSNETLGGKSFIQDITTDGLKKLGKYETFTVRDTTYVVAKKLGAKKKK